MVGGGSLGAEEEKAGRFRVKVSVSVSASASVCWLALGFWGKRGAAEQAGLDWTGLDRIGQGGWVCGWMGGEVVSFWDAGLRTGWAARGDTEVQEGAKPGIH